MIPSSCENISESIDLMSTMIKFCVFKIFEMYQFLIHNYYSSNQLMMDLR